MKKSTFPLILGLCGVGFLSGFAGKRLTAGDTISLPGPTVPQKSASPTAPDVTDGDSLIPSRSKARKLPATTSNFRSTDTLETLAALDHQSLYSRLALWMLDASEQDIAAYWATAKDKTDRPNEITDLIFVNWARLNPQAAIAAVAGTSTEHHAWWAWSCHDPKGALAAAIAANPDRVNNVAWGIGEFHGDWLRENFDKIPEDARSNAIRGMTKWDDTDEPEEILEFLKKNGDGFNARIFATLVRRDPWAAYDWIKENETTITSEYGSSANAMDMLVKTMGETQPDALQRLADQTPSGEAKRKMEAVLFENLVKTDPEAALEQANATQAPRIAAERFAALGLSLVQTDTPKALELAGKLFTAYPDALEGTTRIHYPNGNSGSGSPLKGVEALVDGLMDKDPAAVLDMIPQTSTSNDPFSESRTFSNLANRWARQDLVAYTQWVNQQTEPEVRDQAAAVVVSQLTRQSQFQEATEWAMSSEKTQSGIFNIIHQWNRIDPAEASAWLESSNLPEKQKENYRTILESQRNQ